VNICLGVQVSVLRSGGRKPYRQLTTSWVSLAAVPVVALGAGLLYLAGRSDLWTGRGVWATFWAQLGTSLIVAVGLALLWDLVGKRAFAREILETARIAADVETAGLLGAGTKIYEADWERYFTTVRELDIFFAYGNTWRGLNQTRLSRLAAQPHARIRVFLPDPDQTSVIEQLASRFSKEAAQVGTLIEEAHRDFAQLATNARAEVSIHYWPGDMLFTMYRFDSTILVALYTHRRGRQDVPMLVCSKGGSLYEFFADELEEISQRSQPATGT
jgi:hypothetical protein